MSRASSERVPHEDNILAHSAVLVPDAFKAAFRRHPAGVAVITADSGGGPVGLTATSVISVSAEPPLLVFSLSASSSATAAITEADTVVVHLVPATELETAKRFATSGIDRFADMSTWTRAATGEPVLLCSATRIRGKIIDRLTAGGSVIVAAQALEVSVPTESVEPLVYFDRTWHTLDESSELPARG